MIKQTSILLWFLLLGFLLLGDFFIIVFTYGIGGDSEYSLLASVLLGGIWGYWIAQRAFNIGAFTNGKD